MPLWDVFSRLLTQGPAANHTPQARHDQVQEGKGTPANSMVVYQPGHQTPVPSPSTPRDMSFLGFNFQIFATTPKRITQGTQQGGIVTEYDGHAFQQSTNLNLGAIRGPWSSIPRLEIKISKTLKVIRMYEILIANEPDTKARSKLKQDKKHHETLLGQYQSKLTLKKARRVSQLCLQ